MFAKCHERDQMKGCKVVGKYTGSRRKQEIRAKRTESGASEPEIKERTIQFEN